MSNMNKRGKNWAVKSGKVVLETPAVLAKEEQVPVARLDRELDRTAKRKVQAEARLAEAQKEVDELVAYEAELKELRAQLPE